MEGFDAVILDLDALTSMFKTCSKYGTTAFTALAKSPASFAAA